MMTTPRRGLILGGAALLTAPAAARAQGGGQGAVIDITRARTEPIPIAVPALAGHGYEIVRYREDRGRFTQLRQLDEVPGLAGKLTDDDRAGLCL